MSEDAHPFGHVHRVFQMSCGLARDPIVQEVLESLGELHETSKIPAILSEEAYWSRFYKLTPKPIYGDIDQEAMNLAFESVKGRIMNHCGNYAPLSHQQAMHHMNLQASPGWPWGQGGLKKHDYLDDDYILSELDDIMDQLGQVGDIPLFGYTASLKEELLPREKVLKKATRIFLQQGFELVYLMNVLFGGFTEKFKIRGREFGSAVGISKYYGGWNELARRLLRGDRKRKTQATDSTNHDGSVKVREIAEWFALKWDCLHPTLKTTRMSIVFSKLLHYHVHAMVVGLEGTLFCLHGKNKSGQFATTELNTFTLLVRNLYSFLVLTGQTPDAFWAKVPFFAYGDDTIWTVPKDLEHFNATNVAKVHADHGICAVKAEANSVDLQDATFLSQKFYYDLSHEWWFAVPNTESSYASLLEGGDGTRSPVKTFVRLSSLRLDGFMDLKWRQLTWDVREKLLDYIDTNDPEFVAVANSWYNDAEGVRAHTQRWECDQIIHWLRDPFKGETRGLCNENTQENFAY